MIKADTVQSAACNLTKQAAEEQLESQKRIYSDADHLIIPNKTGGCGAKIIIEYLSEL